MPVALQTGFEERLEELCDVAMPTSSSPDVAQHDSIVAVDLQALLECDNPAQRKWSARLPLRAVDRLEAEARGPLHAQRRRRVVRGMRIREVATALPKPRAQTPV